MRGSEGQPEGSEGLLEGSEGLLEGSEGLPEGSEGLPEGFEGLPGGPGRTYGQTYGRNFSPFYRTSSPVEAAAQKGMLWSGFKPQGLLSKDQYFTT